MYTTNSKLNYLDLSKVLNTHLKSSFAVPANLIPELEKYKLVYWSASYIYKQLMQNLEYKTNFNLYLNYQDTLYLVTMQNCDLDTLYSLASKSPAQQIRISFRKARKHWNLPAAAIIKLPSERKTLIDLRDSKGNYNHD